MTTVSCVSSTVWVSYLVCTVHSLEEHSYFCSIIMLHNTGSGYRSRAALTGGSEVAGEHTHLWREELPAPTGTTMEVCAPYLSSSYRTSASWPPRLCVSANFSAGTVYLLSKLPSLGELVPSHSRFTRGHEGHFPLLSSILSPCPSRFFPSISTSVWHVCHYTYQRWQPPVVFQIRRICQLTVGNNSRPVAMSNSQPNKMLSAKSNPWEVVPST